MAVPQSYSLSCSVSKFIEISKDVTAAVLMLEDRPERPCTDVVPEHALSTEERQSILDICHSEEFSSLPPTQIVPTLSDRGSYLASESTFYRMLRAHNEQHRRR
ncbi:MAG: helix-turn-helix domain-containing protein [Acidimicrobiales bacterium]